jgi:hypothetical protein
MMRVDDEMEADMLEQMLLQSNMVSRLGQGDTVAPRAYRLFDRAVRAGRRKKLRAAILGQSRRLLALSDMQADIQIVDRYNGGTRAVALDQIRGSMNRAGDFDRDFYPVQERTENRWIRVATAMLRGEVLPPVELIQVRDTYFVVDGHHRLSAARALKHSHVDAAVTVWEIAK